VTEDKRSFTQLSNDMNWYAVYTKPRWEKKVAATLEEMGIENYCPLVKTLKQWSDRKKIVLEPLFKSYVFVHISDAEKWSLTKINGILNLVLWLGKPAIIKEEEIIVIKKFLNSFTDIQVVPNEKLEIKSRVRVKNGLFMDYKGVLIELYGNRAKVRLECMGIQMDAKFEKGNLETFM
jgi:transcription antitermination factor NusG